MSPTSQHEQKTTSNWSFVLHALISLGLLFWYNWHVCNQVPIAVEGIGSIYLFFFYHFPPTMNMFLFFVLTAIFSGLYLIDKNEKWDRHARVCGQIGLLCCSLVVATGSVWARMAWGVWWDWKDPRLLFAALTWLSYCGYVLLQFQVDNPEKRMKFSAVFGVIAVINVPLVHYAIKMLGNSSHPLKIQSTSEGINVAKWGGVLVFIVFYLLIYRWRYRAEYLHDSVLSSFYRTRRIEEGILDK